MHVSDLQQHLKAVATLLVSCKATAVNNDILRVVAGLEPFKDYSAADFADFLVKADEFNRTGIIPTKSRRVSSVAVDETAVINAAQQVAELLERVVDDSVTYKDIDAHIKKLGKLKATELKQLATEVGISGKFRTKTEALNAIQELFTSKKRSAMMTKTI